MIKRFKPQEDITAYELAVIFGALLTGPLGKPPAQADIFFTEDKWAETPETIRRHFVDA